MPVGDYTKDQIREIAAKIDSGSKKKDSQEICFKPDQDYASLYPERDRNRGTERHFVNTKGQILREGLPITLQEARRGLGLMGHRVFVLETRRNERGCGRRK